MFELEFVVRGVSYRITGTTRGPYPRMDLAWCSPVSASTWVDRSTRAVPQNIEMAFAVRQWASEILRGV